MNRASSFVLVAACGAALLLTACGSVPAPRVASGGHQRTSRSAKPAPPTIPSTGTSSGSAGSAGPGATPAVANPNPPGPPVADAPGKECVAALAAAHVDTSHVTETSGGPPSEAQIRLSASLKSGPVPQANGWASGIDTATWNLLSGAAGLPLTPYLGQTLAQVTLNNWGSLRIGDYVCFEDGGKVVGMLGQQPYYSFQPMQDVTIQGKTIQELTGLNYLKWLESVGAYNPQPVPNSPSLTAQEALLDYFAALNADLTPQHQEAIGATLVPSGQRFGSTASIFQALVPLSVSPWQPQYPGSASDPQLHQEFGVALWPDFRNFNTNYLAGDGWVGEFITVDRSSTSSPWLVTGFGTGP